VSEQRRCCDVISEQETDLKIKGGYGLWDSNFSVHQQSLQLMSEVASKMNARLQAIFEQLNELTLAKN
jgi:hypothetical protein